MNKIAVMLVAQCQECYLKTAFYSHEANIETCCCRYCEGQLMLNEVQVFIPDYLYEAVVCNEQRQFADPNNFKWVVTSDTTNLHLATNATASDGDERN